MVLFNNFNKCFNNFSNTFFVFYKNFTFFKNKDKNLLIFVLHIIENIIKYFIFSPIVIFIIIFSGLLLIIDLYLDLLLAPIIYFYNRKKKITPIIIVEPV